MNVQEKKMVRPMMEQAIAALKVSVSDTSEQCQKVLAALGQMQQIGPTFNFPKVRDEASNEVVMLTNMLESLTSDMMSVGDSTIAYVMGVVDPIGRCPLNQDVVSACHEWLPSNTLHHPTYLHFFNLGDAIQSCDNPADVSHLEPMEYLVEEPDEMSVTKILSRTAIFVQRMADEEEGSWLFSSYGVIRELAQQLQDYIAPTAVEMTDALQSKELERVAIDMLNNPACETPYLNCIEDMMDKMKANVKFMADLSAMADFYQKLFDVLVKTEETVDQAYDLLANCCKVQF